MPEQSARNLALTVLHTDEVTIPDLRRHVEPQSSEAMSLIDNLKVKRYASLARVVDRLLDRSLGKREERGTDGLLGAPLSDIQPCRPWSQLADDFSFTLSEDIAAITGTEAFANAQKYTEMIGTLDPDRFIDLQMQLEAGGNTASSTMATLLRSIPRLAVYHDPETPPELYPAIARRSLSLVGRLALTCVNRLMAARAGLVAQSSWHEWKDDKSELYPLYFTLRPSRDGIPSLQYADLDEVEVPKSDDSYLRGIEPGAGPVTVGQVDCYNMVTIGCPVTLLHGRLQQLWNWQIDAVVTRGLWEDRID